MRTIAVANQKGGVAKTTTAVNTAAALVDAGHPALVIDLDPQGTATRWLGADVTGAELFELLTEDQPPGLDDLVQPTKIPDLDLVAASRLLAVERRLVGVVGIELRLQAALAAAARRPFVLIDCPPNLGTLVIAALAAATEVLIPVTTHFVALPGLLDLTQTIERVRTRLNPKLRLAGVLATRVRRRTNLDAEVLAELGRRFPDHLLPTVIHDSVRLAEAPSHYLPINHYQPGGRSAQEYAAVATALLGGSTGGADDGG